jgi:hypothetical protein
MALFCRLEHKAQAGVVAFVLQAREAASPTLEAHAAGFAHTHAVESAVGTAGKRLGQHGIQMLGQPRDAQLPCELVKGILGKAVALPQRREGGFALLPGIGHQGQGLRYFADSCPDIRSLHVMDEPLQVVCAAHSRFVTGTPTEPAALQGVPWFSFPRKTGSAGEALAQLLEQQLLRHDLQSAERIVIDSLTAQKRLIEADFGIGLLPESSIEEELRLGTVRILPITALQTVQPVVLIFRRPADGLQPSRRESAITGI